MFSLTIVTTFVYSLYVSYVLMGFDSIIFTISWFCHNIMNYNKYVFSSTNVQFSSRESSFPPPPAWNEKKYQIYWMANNSTWLLPTHVLRYLVGQLPLWHSMFAYVWLTQHPSLTHVGRYKMASLWQTTFFKCIFLNENCCILIQV